MKNPRWVARMATLVLSSAGCILIAVSAFLVALPLGFLVSGLACFALDWHLDAERQKK